MKVRYFCESAYNDFFDSISKNIHFYEQNDNGWIQRNYGDIMKLSKESRLDVNLPLLKVEDGELANTIAIHQAFKDILTPKQASNPFLWAYLTHCQYWDYTVERWSKEGISKETIKQRFFCGPEEGNRIGFLRNSISRLWWIGSLTYLGNSSPSPYELTDLLLSHSDLCLSIIERNFSMNKEITIGILSAIKEINDDPNRQPVGKSQITGEYEWRDLCKYINRYGAVSLLDALDRETIKILSYDYIISKR